MHKSWLIPLALIPSALAANVANAEDTPPPHVVLIMCDDMGFSDLGCYGSEIRTPHIDALANAGVRFSQFKNTGRSCPSRAALLTGYYQHEAGMGWMTAVDEHRPGYRGQIAREIPTLAEVMRDNGYATYMSGKWHVTLDGAYGHPNGSYPVERGFERYYGCLSGGGSYYHPTPLYNDLTPVTDVPDDYYYTTALTDSAVSFVEHHDESRPMFLYVAYYAPHLPLQAPRDRVEQCRDRYRVGYDVLRKQRFERQKQLGLIPDTMSLPQFDREFGQHRPAWTELTEAQRQQWTNDMATYAAMVEIMDDGVGAIVEALRAKNMWDNTVLMFLSDNGATLEGGFIGQLMADLSNTPYRSYKQWCFQGGTSTPFILTYGDAERNAMAGQWCRQPAHIIDILPTCVELAHGSYPTTYKGGRALPGQSLLTAAQGGETQERELFFEHQSSCAVIRGQWKLVRADARSPWELYDLEADPFETVDLASQQPQRVETLEAAWNHWAETHNVLPLENKPWSQRINFYKKHNPDQDGID